jgi:hypothetical protein
MRASRRSVGLVVLALLTASAAFATTVRRMNLDALTRSAGRIFRGTVLEIEEGSVEVGGGKLPTRTFTIRVDDGLKGDFTTEKEVPVVELRTIGKTAPVTVGDARWVRVLPEPPDLVVGSSYLLFVTAPSAIGLSTTVGLGQGCFRILGEGEHVEAVNELDNVGLAPPGRESLGLQGPIPYSLLAREVRAIVAGS